MTKVSGSSLAPWCQVVSDPGVGELMEHQPLLKRAGAGGADVDLAPGGNSAMAAGVAVTGAGVRVAADGHVGRLEGGLIEQTTASRTAASCPDCDMLIGRSLVGLTAGGGCLVWGQSWLGQRVDCCCEPVFVGHAPIVRNRHE
jgi:hypothetical protein